MRTLIVRMLTYSGGIAPAVVPHSIPKEENMVSLLIPHTQHLWLFSLMALCIIALPGMDMVYVMASALARGRRIGFAAVAGIVVGRRGACGHGHAGRRPAAHPLPAGLLGAAGPGGSLHCLDRLERVARCRGAGRDWLHR